MRLKVLKVHSWGCRVLCVIPLFLCAFNLSSQSQVKNKNILSDDEDDLILKDKGIDLGDEDETKATKKKINLDDEDNRKVKKKKTK